MKDQREGAFSDSERGAAFWEEMGLTKADLVVLNQLAEKVPVDQLAERLHDELIRFFVRPSDGVVLEQVGALIKWVGKEWATHASMPKEPPPVLDQAVRKRLLSGYRKAGRRRKKWWLLAFYWDCRARVYAEKMGSE